MPKADQKTVSQVFSDAKLQVPLYQRSYAWEPQQVEDLLNDIDYVYRRRYGSPNARSVTTAPSDADSNDTNGNSDVYHYFGTLVLNARGKQDMMGSEWTVYDIIDGQQRLTTTNVFIACIVEELEAIADAFDAAGLGKEDLPEGVVRAPGYLATNYTENYLKLGDRKEGRHLEPGELTEAAYAELIIDQGDPQTILDDDERLVPEKKLARAKKIIQKWIREKRELFLGDEDLGQAMEADLLEYYTAIKRYTGVLTSQFKLTSQEVESTDEAGRLFEAVNDRGRDITLADKVKSYLIYVSGEFDTLDSEAVARRFNDAVETVAQYATDDDDIDQLVQFHWELFTGEYKKVRKNRSGPTPIHRRIKESPRHIPLERDPEEVATWVNNYVDTLSSVSKSYVQANYLDVFNRQTDVSPQVQARVKSLHNINFSNIAPLIIAAIERYDADSPEFARIATLCEVYSFRVYQVAKRSQRTARREFKEAAHRLYASEFEDGFVEDLFGEAVVDPPYENPAVAVDEVTAYLDNYIGRHCPDNDFVEYLTRSDIIQGSDTRGWPGFCNKGAIRFLLFEYEKHLRQEKNTDTSLKMLPSVMDLNEFTIEHIAPRTPETSAAELENHEENVNRLGNLALLGPKDNPSASNDDYATKYEEIYQDAQMEILGDDLPAPAAGWDVDALDARARDIVAFALDHWSGESAAVVTIAQGSSDAAEEAATDPRTDTAFTIRDDAQRTYAEDVDADPSRVKLVRQGDADMPSSGADGVTELPQCSCGALYTRISDGEDDTEMYECVCGSSLEAPNLAGITRSVLAD